MKKVKKTKCKDGSGYTYFANEHPELRKFELDLWNESHDAGFLPEITHVVPFQKVIELFGKDILPLLYHEVKNRTERKKVSE